MTRKSFLEVVAGAAAMAAGTSAVAAAPRATVKLGVTLYSYSGDFARKGRRTGPPAACHAARASGRRLNSLSKQERRFDA